MYGDNVTAAVGFPLTRIFQAYLCVFATNGRRNGGGGGGDVGSCTRSCGVCDADISVFRAYSRAHCS